ncbi:MAG: aminopeptidase [Chloroflexi bacterium HGW-Chloroflexi-10]|nr:MAG: aminopeptidase [Chloroflexi bacterium HGW-Chloroflexi-10]
MTELKEHLKSLISLSGLSGHETPVRDVIREAWQPLVDEISVSRLGSLHALRRGNAHKPRPSILLAAHMDAIGLMVTGIQEGLLRFTNVGGVDPRILPGQEVTVHGRKDLPGVVIQPPDYLLPASQHGKSVAMEYLFVDTGLYANDVEEFVRVGDLISFAQKPLELAGNTLAGHSLDNRVSVAAITSCLEELQHIQHAWDVWAVATVQEEETLGGGFTSPFDLRPQIAVAIDVTFAKGPNANDWRTVHLAKGPTLGWGPNVHPYIYKRFSEMAEKLDIPHQKEYMPGHSGTDAYAMQVVAEGFPTMVVGIPLRYMHTPVELISLKDMERTGRILAETIARLEVDFMEKISWDEVNDEEK